MAATEEGGDWTAGPLLGLSGGVLYVADMRRVQASAHTVETLVMQTAQVDGPKVRIRMEQEPGASGKAMVASYARKLPGFDFRGIPSTGDKIVRANPLSSMAEAGNVKLVQGPWVREFLEEAEMFPNGPHDDQIDACSAGLSDLRDEKAVYIGGLDHDPMAGFR